MRVSVEVAALKRLTTLGSDLGDQRLTLSGGKVTSCAIGLTNVGDTALFAKDAAAILTGSSLDDATVKRAVAAAEAITSPASDAHGPAEYRTKMAGVMLRRALARARSRAKG